MGSVSEPWVLNPHVFQKTLQTEDALARTLRIMGRTKAGFQAMQWLLADDKVLTWKLLEPLRARCQACQQSSQNAKHTTGAADVTLDCKGGAQEGKGLQARQSPCRSVVTATLNPKP